MTAIAAYEKHHREELSATDSWFRGDFIGMRMLKNGCRFTLAFFIGFAFYFVMNLDEMLDLLNSMDVMGVMKSALIWYGAALAVYLVLTYAVYSVLYHQAEKRRRTYIKLIDRLEAEYQRKRRGPSRRRRRERLDRSL